MPNDNPNEGSTLTQCKQILAHLLKGLSLTSLEALELFKCFRLASRISELRLELLIPISSEFIKLPNGKKVKKYYITKENLAIYNETL